MAKHETGMSKEMIESIKNYGDQIVEIEDQVTAVRQTPDVYIGTLGNEGYLTMVREILQNSIDEILKGFSPSKLVKVWFDERTKQVTVEDFSRGIPHGKIITIFGRLHTSSNYDKQDGQFSAGKNGQGGSLVNMLSSKFVVESYVLGTGRRVEFIEGHAWDKGEVDITGKETVGKQGALITFIPAFQVLGEVTTTWSDLYNLIAKITPVTTVLGTTVEFSARDNDGILHEAVFVNDRGIMSHIENMVQRPMIKPIYLSCITGKMKAEIALTYSVDFDSLEQIMDFANTCPTLGGTHVDGFLDGITKFFRDYMNKIYLVNSKKKLLIVGNDIRTGLKAVVSVFHLNARYTGQNKETLKNEDMRPFVATLVYKGLEEWIKSNSADLQKLCKYFKDVAELRVKSDESRVKLSSNYEQDVLNPGMPAKFVKPNGKNDIELIIVEGDSAKGSIELSRNKETQGVFPIRGKIPNAFTTNREKFLANPEISGIIAILGAGYGKSFDITKCKWSKVICGCFTGDTKVKMLDGVTKTFEQLVYEESLNPGKEYWVYSYNTETKEYVPAKAYNPHITRYVNKLCKVTFDDGGYILCTPDHKFLTNDNGYIEAQNLCSNESIVSLNIKKNNHKVNSVEYIDLENSIPVYCITVPEYHNFAVMNSVENCIMSRNCDADPKLIGALCSNI